MVRLADLDAKHRFFLMTYPFHRFSSGQPPLAPLLRPLSSCRVAVVTTAGLYGPLQPPFDTDKKGGDSSFREIARDTDPSTLRCSHRSDAFDATGLADDPNLALPLDRLREMVEAGLIAEVAPRHISFMGSITKPAVLIEETAPRAAALLKADAVDAALLTPV